MNGTRSQQESDYNWSTRVCAYVEHTVLNWDVGVEGAWSKYAGSNAYELVESSSWLMENIKNI